MGLREQKHGVLLDPIAGRDRIQAFLAPLGQEAQASGVEIRRYELLPHSAKATERRSWSSPTSKPESGKNHIQGLGCYQSLIVLQVNGG